MFFALIGIKKKEEVIDGVKVHRCFHIARAVNFVTIFPSVFFKLLKGNFDIIHSQESGHPHVFFSSLAAMLTGTKHIHTTHCPWTTGFRSAFGNLMVPLVYNIFMRFVYKTAYRVVAITPWEIEFIKKYGCDENKLEIIPNGVDAILFKKFSNNFKKRNDIKGKMILYFGRLNITKGPDKFVLAAKEIIKERKDIFFVIRGPDEGMKSTIERMIKNEKRIILLPATRDKKEIALTYQAADVFVLPSYREGLPLTLFEAMACGLPVVASPVNGVPYEMKEPENGFFAEYGKIKKLKEKILLLLDNKGLANKISKNNRQKAKKYLWDSIADIYLKLYSSDKNEKSR